MTSNGIFSYKIIKQKKDILDQLEEQPHVN